MQVRLARKGEMGAVKPRLSPCLAEAKQLEFSTMTKYRHRLPQLGDQLFLTDAGIETTLIFHDKLDLPCFASFHLLKDANNGRSSLS